MEDRNLFDFGEAIKRLKKGRKYQDSAGMVKVCSFITYQLQVIQQ